MTSIVARPQAQWMSARSEDPTFRRYQRYVQAEKAAGRRPLPEHKWRERFVEGQAP